MLQVLHGEWILKGERLPGGDHRNALPVPNPEDGGTATGLSERTAQPPEFAELDEVDDEVDGCAAQFQCGTNEHQVSSPPLAL